MATVLICTKTDGTVGVLCPAEGVTLERLKTVDCIELMKAHPEIIEWHEVDESQIPTDSATNEFFNCWTFNPATTTFGVDLQKSVQLKLAKVRAQREPLLSKYDGLQLRAMDMDDQATIASVKQKKQQLRDCTNALKALTPANLQDINAAAPSLEGF